MASFDDVTSALKGPSISTKNQHVCTTVTGTSLASFEDLSTAPGVDVSSFTSDKGSDVEATHAEERAEVFLVHRSGVRRLYDFLRTVVFTVYRQLLTIVCLANLVAILSLLCNSSGLSLETAATAAVANLTIAILIRQDYIRNILFSTCWNIPHSAPLWLRRRLAKVYENGGVHSGGAVCAIGWHIAFVSILTRDHVRGRHRDIALLSLCYALLAGLVTIAGLALPQMRDRHHNVFENVHRFGGWFCVLTFWPILVLLLRNEAHPSSGVTLANTLAGTPAFWLLAIVSVHVIYPWVLLRKVPVVRVECLSDRAVRLYFSPKEKIPPLYGLVISDSPLREWHSFAAISGIDDRGAASCIVSRAGDWTAKTIKHPADFYYMRGCHLTGTLYMAKVFKRVAIMATGSGVGPCLALFGHAPKTSIRFLWFAPDPRSTFGEKIIGRVLKQDPRAVVWDTQKSGQERPDVVTMAHALYTEMDAEALFFISNKKLTKRVVRDLEALGVSAFAPVFDS